MKIRSKVAIVFTIAAFLFMQIPVFAYTTPSAQQYDFAVTDLKILSEPPFREENEFKIGVSYSYYAINYGTMVEQEDKWVECGKCFGNGMIGGGAKPCMSCGGMGEATRAIPCKAPNGNPKCISTCNGNDYICYKCGKIQNTDFGFKDYCSCTAPHLKVYGPCTCQTGRNETIKCPSCKGSGETNSGAGEEKECPSCKGEGGKWVPVPPKWIPPTRPSAGYTQIDFTIDGVVQSYATQNIIIPISGESSDTSPNGSGWSVWGSAYYEITLNASENIGLKDIEARINWDNKSSETNSSNNSKSTQIDVIPATNLTVEYVEPNAFYRTDTEVITTYIIHNQDNIGALDIKPKHSLTAEFKAINPATNEVVATATKTDIVIPKHGTNIVYFKWRVPQDYPLGDIKLQCDINTTKVQGSVGVPGVNEMDYTDNTAIGTNSVKSGKISQTPDTVFENRPNWFIEPNRNETVQYSTFATELKDTADFEEWIWENGNYKKASYSLKLSANLKLTSDVRNPTGKLNADIWEIKSGYGFSLDGKSVFDNPSAAPTASYTLPQSGNAHFPEHRYSAQSKKYRTLEQTSPGQFEFPQNEFAMNDKGQSENRRVHFSPLWYPDGEYRVAAYYYDCWTPVGMLNVIAEDKILIKGNMYDDWYVNHGGR